MARDLTKSNAHFQRAIKRLPLGVASNFRNWGDDRTISNFAVTHYADLSGENDFAANLR